MVDYNDPIAAFLASIGAASPNMPGSGVIPRPAATPGAPDMPFQPTIDPRELAAASGNPLAAFLGNLNPAARAMIAAAGIMQPTSTAANDTISAQMAGARPEYPHTPTPAGAMGMAGTPILNAPQMANYDPLSSIRTPPVGPLADPPQSTRQPARPVTPTPAAAGPAAPSTKRGIDPAKVDLGQNPRFTTVQYGVPSGRGPLSNNPIFTALNLGGQNG